jgi:hypothetical protein
MLAINTEEPSYTTLTTMPQVLPLQADEPLVSPEPTATPVPTPKPEPTAKPNLEFSCRGASADSFKFEVSGMLSYNNSAIPRAQVYIRSSADGGDSWEDFVLEQTSADGSFNTVWIPKTAGSYLLCAHWAGNGTLRWMNTTLSIALTSDSAGNVFSATSDADITGLSYDASSQTLSFTTNTTQTSTPISICIPKALVNDAKTLLQINIDGKTAEFITKSQNDLWIITCTANQGRHSTTVQIHPSTMMPPVSTPWLTIVIVIAIIIAVAAITTTIRRRRRTAATVAAILKQNRP